MLNIILDITPKETPFFTTGDIIAVVVGILLPIIVLIINGISKGAVKNKTIEDLDTSNKEIKSDITEIKVSIKDLEISNTRIIGGLITVGCNPNIFKVSSPINLTPLGEEILNDITGKSYIDNNEQDLIFKIKNLNPKSELDVETFSKQILFDEFDTDKFIPIKNFIYNNSIYKSIQLNQATIITVMGIYLRDKYLKKYPFQTIIP
jgi:hypothetical protein